MKPSSLPRLTGPSASTWLRFLTVTLTAVLLATSMTYADKGGKGDKGGKKHGGPPHSEKHAREWHDKRGWEHGSPWRGPGNWKASRAHDWHHQHATWVQRGGYGGFYISSTTYSMYFGSGNHFVIASQPVVYMGYPAFTHRGQRFVIVDPYPETWPENWYAHDEVYIVYDDGYYLYNRRRPGFAISVMVVR
jgi:hypothetical protein